MRNSKRTNFAPVTVLLVASILWMPHAAHTAAPQKKEYLSQAEADRPQEEQDLVSSAFTVAEVERMICEGVIKDGVTVAVFGLLRLKGLL